MASQEMKQIIIEITEAEAQDFFGSDWDESEFVVRLPGEDILARRIGPETFFDSAPAFEGPGEVVVVEVEGYGTLDEAVRRV